MTSPLAPRVARALSIACWLVAAAGCQRAPGPARASDVELREAESASEAFWAHWSDNRAELSAYSVSMPRYGEARDGTVVLVYVTEEMNRKTRIKADTPEVPASDREVVLKLNHSLTFRTGIYPYSVLTSVFCPVGSSGRERFAPVKISFTAQEWCGHVFQTIEPTIDRFHNTIRSYFGWEGDRDETLDTAPFALYEDALYIQLRELDGPFAGGGDWAGDIVPQLWMRRMVHAPLRPTPATITREDAARDGVPVARFTLRYEIASPRENRPYWRRFDVETAEPRRILAWECSTGERAEILETARLTYWELNGEGDERYLRELGLDPATGEPIAG